jgi:hypothetical protein
MNYAVNKGMARPPSKTLIWLKKGLSTAGFLAFLAGLGWLWQLRDIWPRAASDPVPQSLLEALGVIIGGLFLVSKAR